MSQEPIEVQLATIATTLSFLQRDMEEARLARKGQYEKQEEHARTLSSINNRLESVESSLKQQAPTIEEFITIRHKVAGAGMLGKWAWGIAFAVITFLFSFRREILTWLTKS